jgi:hypothetical protein
MKRKMFSIMAIAAIALVSCKKDNVDDTALGSATINGTVRADIDQTNDLNGAGLYEQGLNPEGVEGMTVTVEVNSIIYDDSPNGSYDYDVMTYTTTTDASGNFTLTIPATADGQTIRMEFEDLEGVTRTLYSTNGNSVTELSTVSKGFEDVTIYDGANLELVYDANIAPVTAGNNNNDYGMATLTGRVIGNWDNSDDAPNDAWNYFAGAEYYGTGSPLAGITMFWQYNDDFNDAPYDMGYGQVSEFTLQGDGSYSVDIPTWPATSTQNIDIRIGFYDVDANYIIDNQAMTADSLLPAIFSVGGVSGISINNIVDGETRVFNIQPGITVY